MRDAALDALRVGCVKYLNARPLVHGWPGRVVFDHPAALCAQLAQGDLDVALVSSFELFLRPEFLVVDGVAIASHGAVYSVFVVSERPFEEV
ncbi:MAG: MqnA/MqnD/SBP family protein, partial [Chthoniobacterales bacterium]